MAAAGRDGLLVCHVMEGSTPELVAAPAGRARLAGFRYSCEPAVGRLLRRTDVTVTTVEKDPQTAALAARDEWPQFV